MNILQDNPALSWNSLKTILFSDRTNSWVRPAFIVPLHQEKIARILAKEMVFYFSNEEKISIDEAAKMLDIKVLALITLDAVFGGINTQWLFISAGEIFYSKGDGSKSSGL